MTPDLTDADRALVGVLAAFADRDGHDAWAANTTYAWVLSCSVRTVQRRLTKLERLRYIVDVGRRPTMVAGKPHRGYSTTIWNLSLPDSGVTQLCRSRGDTALSPEEPLDDPLFLSHTYVKGSKVVGGSHTITETDFLFTEPQKEQLP